MRSAYKHNQIIAALSIITFLALVFFGLNFMSHGADEGMPGDCPFSAIKSPLCSQDAFAMAFHHIFAYQSFVNVPINFSFAVFIILLLLIAYTNSTDLAGSSLFRPPAVFGIFYNFLPSNSYEGNIAHWLALHENSPTASRTQI